MNEPIKDEFLALAEMHLPDSLTKAIGVQFHCFDPGGMLA